MANENVFPAISGIKHIIAVSSCKGGVGKSTVCAYLAVEMARRGFKVGLADCDIHGPSVPTLFNLQHHSIQLTPASRLKPVEKNNIKLMSFGFLLGDGPAVMRGPIVTRYVQQVLLNTEWGELDYLFIDMPPGTGDVQLTITQTLKLTGSIIVTTPQALSLVDVTRGILMFEKVNVPMLGIINNMAFFNCDECSKKHFIFGREGAVSLQQRFGIPSLANLPILPALAAHHVDTAPNAFFMDAADALIKAVAHVKERNLTEIPMVYADPNNITLKWNDKSPWIVNNKKLRLNCQCALCIHEMTGEKILNTAAVKDDITAIKIIPLGNYALGIEWNDGHTSGIYSYELIKSLSQ